MAEGGAVPRLDGLGGGGVERLGERRRVARPAARSWSRRVRACSMPIDAPRPVGGIGARPGVGHGHHAGGDRLAVDHEAAVAVLQPGHHLDALLQRRPVEPVGDQRKAAHQRLPAVRLAQRPQRGVLRAGHERRWPRSRCPRAG